MTDVAPPAAAPTEPVAPPEGVIQAHAPVPATLAVADALATAATRLALLAVPWLFAVTGAGLRFTVAGTVALAGRTS